MSTSKHFDKFCCIVMAAVLLITVLFVNGEALGLTPAARAMGYESRLFDRTQVHTINLVVDGWEEFLTTCTNEEYIQCSAVIDGEAYKNIALRAKGNTSLSSVKSYGNDRYSFKIEFDHYDSANSYHGLDKLCLNNIIQDNTYMKDFLVYQMMSEYGACAPLCSFAYITVNGEDWGLYLAVEAVEESFLQRNFSSNYGELYKPDSMDMGGGRGNGKDFDMGEFTDDESRFDPTTLPQEQDSAQTQRPSDRGDRGKGGFGGMGSSDVKLQYIDDDPASYSAIFDSAKTDVSDTDKQRLIAALKELSQQDTSAVMTEEVLRYFVVHNFVCNGDSYTGSMIHNYYLYEQEGQLAMLPWDYNLAFGGFDGGDATSTVNSPIDTPISGTAGEDRPMAYWIFSDKERLAQYHEYFSEFLTQLFDSGAVTRLIDKTAQLIAPYVEKDPTKFCTTEQFEAGVAALKEFCTLRVESVKGQLSGAIPSTTEGQTNSSALVDASQLDLSDMGSMGHGMGGRGDNGGFERPSFGQQTTPETDTQTAETPNDTAPPEMPEGMTPPSDFGGFDGAAPPNGFGGQPPAGGMMGTPPA